MEVDVVFSGVVEAVVQGVHQYTRCLGFFHKKRLTLCDKILDSFTILQTHILMSSVIPDFLDKNSQLIILKS